MNILLNHLDSFFSMIFGHPDFLKFFIPLLIVSLLIINRFKIIPNKVQLVVELIYQLLETQFKPLFKHEADYKKWMPFFLTIFVYILILNLMGIVPGMEALTSHIELTAGMAIMVFIISTVVGIKRNGPINYFVLLTPSGIPVLMRVIMFPIEIISMISKPFSLAVRLYANMFAGHTIIKTILGLTLIFESNLIIPLNIIAVTCLLAFEIFIACIQAFVFSYLSAIYISDNLYLKEGH